MADRSQLTTKQYLFAEAYIGTARGNALEAAREAGYAGNDDTLKSIGSENLTKPYLRAYIDARLQEATLSANEVLARLTEHANASIEPFMFQQGDVIGFDLTNNDVKGKLHLVKKCKTKKRSGGSGEKAWEEHEVEFELHDAQAALVQLGRYHKLFSDGQHSDIDAEIKRLLGEVESEREGASSGGVAGEEGA